MDGFGLQTTTPPSSANGAAPAGCITADCTKLGVGIEVQVPSAFQNNVLNVYEDPGHAFVYIRESGRITAILSFGPGERIGAGNKRIFQNGNLRGNAHWPLSGMANTWEFPISSQQMNDAKQAMADFRAHVPNYTPHEQCTTAALSIAARAGVSLPSGVGPVIAINPRLFSDNLANPYHLNQQMTQRYGAPTVVDTNSFPPP
jgi:hypothetical protein